MRIIRLFLMAVLVSGFVVACSDQDGVTVPDPANAVIELSDVMDPSVGIVPLALVETPIEFGAVLPSSFFFPLDGAMDYTVGGRDCCIRDDVVELYVNGCYIGMIDSRGGDPGTHEYEYFDIRLPTGDYQLEYRNVVSSVGPSGWFVSQEDAPLGSIEGAVVPECFLGALDIKPGSWPNSINRNSGGVTPVAILGSETFDVTTIDVTTLWFAGSTDPAHDLTDPWVYADHLQDVNYDGYTDLVTHWRTRDLDLADDATEACMLAQDFYACDAVNIVK